MSIYMLHEQINIQSKYDMKMKIFRGKWLDLTDSIKQILILSPSHMGR